MTHLSLPPSLPLSPPTQVALDACSSMRSGFGSFVPLDPPCFPRSSSPPSTTNTTSPSQKMPTPSSSPPRSSSSPPGQRLLEALVQSPSKQLSLQAASALLNLDVTSLVEEHR